MEDYGALLRAASPPNRSYALGLVRRAITDYKMEHSVTNLREPPVDPLLRASALQPPQPFVIRCNGAVIRVHRGDNDIVVEISPAEDGCQPGHVGAPVLVGTGNVESAGLLGDPLDPVFPKDVGPEGALPSKKRKQGRKEPVRGKRGGKETAHRKRDAMTPTPAFTPPTGGSSTEELQPPSPKRRHLYSPKRRQTTQDTDGVIPPPPPTPLPKCRPDAQGEQEYMCPEPGCPKGIIGKGFTNRSNLNRHMRVHTGEKPYLCEQCNKAFSQSNNLKVHAKSCTGKPREDAQDDVSASPPDPGMEETRAKSRTGKPRAEAQDSASVLPSDTMIQEMQSIMRLLCASEHTEPPTLSLALPPSV
jgi:hypothetical protein